jgi:DNA mismatch repair protein MutL
LNEAYRGILVSGRFPLAFLQIELPPDLFDVNVHPTKMEVRFLDSNRIYTGFLGAIREKFLASDLRSRVQTADSRRQTVESATVPPWEADDPQSALDPSAAEKKRQAVQDWIAQMQTGGATERRQTESSRSPLSIHHLPDRSAPLGEIDEVGNRPPSGCVRYSALETPSRLSPTLPPLPPSGRQPTGEDSVSFSPTGHLVVQMLDRYLVMETEDGIAFVDQHALHERILYEQLKTRMSAGQLESQRLLVPILVDLSPVELSCVQDNADFFKTLGLQVEPFGGNTMLISAFPAVLSKTSPEEILWSLIEPFLESGKKLSRNELLDEMLHSMACKAAVKAGDRLSSGSMQHLIQLAEREINAHHCPHGRPSTLVFTREEIDRMFDRT